MVSIILITIIALAILTVITVLSCAFSWYVVVPPSEAHLVVTPRKRMVVSSDPKVAKDAGSTYFAIPSYIPFFGRAVRAMDVTTKELVWEQETYEKNQARYTVRSSTKYRIKDVQTAAETFINDSQLQSMLKEVIQAAVRAITVKYDVIEARAKKSLMSTEIYSEVADDLACWGLSLENFQLVDFQDTNTSKIISDISRRREVEIEAETREMNAEKKKQARVKEAEADEIGRVREVARDEKVAKREQDKNKVVAEQEKLAEEKRYEVIRVQTVEQAEIDKEKAIVEAKQEKETELIIKEQKKLEGEGDRLKAEEVAKGLAAPIREKGFAEAEAKEKLQAALNKFGDAAIRTLVAEKIVEMQEVVGLKTAEALAQADVRVFAGGSEGDKSSFDLSKAVASMMTGNEGLTSSVLHRLKKPNDLGIGSIPLEVDVPKRKFVKKKDGKSAVGGK